MKKYLLLILASVLSISGYAVQTDNGTGATKSGSTWYSTIVSKQYDIQDGNNLDIYFSYPSNQVKFDVYRKKYTGIANNKKIEIQQQLNGSWSVFYTYTVDNHNQWYRGVETNGLSTNATGIAFRRVAGSAARYIENVYIRMAPHTKMNTSSISFVNVPVGTTQTQTIDFYSFLSGGSGIQAYVIDNNNNKVNVPGLSLNRTSISANECEKVGENNYSITVTFNPQSIFSLTGYKVRIVNSGAVIGSSIDIPINTLSSALTPPTLSCTVNAYDYVTLSWNKIDGATSYNIYDNNTLIKSATSTSATITGLIMGSNHKYTVKSVYASSLSNPSNVVDVTTHSYPKTSSIWFSNVSQNSFTINWNKVDILANHEFVRYRVHIYYHDYYDVRCERPTAYQIIENIENINTTSLTINDVDDATRFIVYVGADFMYTLNGNTKTYNVSEYTKDGQHAGWVNAIVETPTTYNSSAEIANGIYIYKGEWHYINVNIANDLLGVLLGKQWPFYYPPENLKYRAWVSEAGNVTHYVEDDATGRKYKLTGTNYGYTTYDTNNKLQTEVYSISQTLDKVVFTGSRDPFGGQKIYVGDVYSKVARHILMENDTINLGDVRINDNIDVPIKFKSFLVDNELKATSDNSDFKPSKSVICGKAIKKSGTFCQLDNRSYDFNVRFTPSREGEAIAHITVSDGIRSRTVTIMANVMRYNTFFAEGQWTDNDNWTFGLPFEDEDVMIAANVTVPNNIAAKVKDVVLNDNISITIKPQAVLKINTIDRGSNTDIIIESNELNTGSFLYRNTDKVNATIQLYSKAFSEGLKNDIAGNFLNPAWQYIGIITESLNYSVLNPDGVTNWMYKWDETQNAVSCWSEKLNQQSSLYAWNGYCIAQEHERTYTYSGNLLNENHTYNLTYTKSAASTDDLGNNLITNSYSAPIDIESLSSTANFVNAEATIFIYNTGSYAEWKEQASNTLGFNPGQTIAIPVNVVSTLGSEYPHTIASSQAFFLASYPGGGQFIVDYEKNVYNPASSSNQKRIIRHDNTFNVLKINVQSTKSNDRLYLIEHEDCTPNFDNGYDAIKIFDNNGPQIFAINDSIYTSINTSNSIVNQSIGFRGDSEYEMYTLTFNIDKLYSYDKLYLYDIITNEYVDILSNETYTFYHIQSNNEPRFLITTDKKNGDRDIVTATETIDSFNEINLNDIIYIYNFNGHLIYNSKVDSSNDLNNLTNGIYIVITNNKTFKLCLLK
jgi:hypothetical protein